MATEAPTVPSQTDMAKGRKGDTVTPADARAEMERASAREEKRRDLLMMVDGIDEEDAAEIIFENPMPPRKMAIIFSTQDGEPLPPMTRKRARILLKRPFPEGGFMFTAHGYGCDCGNCTAAQRAPEYKLGAEKCFLAEGSKEREELDDLRQLPICKAKHLANAFAKFAHETGGKHAKSYKIWEKHVADTKEAEAIDRQDRQFQATMDQNAAILELARGPQPQTATPQVQAKARACNNCGAEITGKLKDHRCA